MWETLLFPRLSCQCAVGPIVADTEPLRTTRALYSGEEYHCPGLALDDLSDTAQS